MVESTNKQEQRRLWVDVGQKELYKQEHQQPQQQDDQSQQLDDQPQQLKKTRRQRKKQNQKLKQKQKPKPKQPQEEELKKEQVEKEKPFKQKVEENTILLTNVLGEKEILRQQTAEVKRNYHAL